MSYVKPETEYKDFIKLIESSNKNNNNEVYSLLQGKEKDVLDTVNRVVDHEKGKRDESTLFYNLSFLTLVAMFANTWKNIYREVVIERNIKNIVYILTKDDRKIYVGIMILLIVFFLFFIEINS